MQYQGKEVTVVRDAHQGDQGFDAAKAPQSLIQIDPNTQKVVLKSEVTN